MMRNSSTNSFLVRMARIGVAVILGLFISTCSDSDNNGGTGPVNAPPTDYFWDMRVPANFADFQAVGVEFMDTVVLAITNDRYYDDTTMIRTTLISFDRAESWSYGPNLVDTIYHGLKKFDQMFYAIGNQSIFRSFDGESWAPTTWVGTGDSTQCGCELQDMAKGTNRFVAVANRYLAYSTSGTSWTLVSRPQITSDNVFFNSVTFDGSRFTVLAANFTRNRTEFYTSNDGTSWSVTGSIEISGLQVPAFNDLIWADSGFIVVGTEGLMYKSGDATNWTRINSPTLADLTFVEWGNRQYIVGGTFGTLMVSNDGVNWTVQTIAQQRTFLAAIWTGIRYVAVGENLISVTDLPKN